MNPFDAIEKLITEHGSAAILRERIAQLKDQFALSEKRASEAEVREKALQLQLSEARAEIQRLQPAGLAENDGLLWKRTASGFESRPYCPRCTDHPVMMVFPPGSKELWVCPSNHTFAYDSHPPAA